MVVIVQFINNLYMCYTHRVVRSLIALRILYIVGGLGQPFAKGRVRPSRGAITGQGKLNLVWDTENYNEVGLRCF